MYALPPFTTHKLQPLDASVFSSVKRDFTRICHEAYLSQENIVAKRENVPSVLNTILSNDKYKRLAIEGFKKTGIYPLNPDHHIQEAQQAFDLRYYVFNVMKYNFYDIKYLKGMPYFTEASLDLHSKKHFRISSN